MSTFTTPLEYELYGYDSKKKRNTYKITSEFEYRIGDFDNPFGIITVPVGFITDFASIPWPINRWFKPTGKWAKAAVIHDHMLVVIDDEKIEHTRATADAILYEAMLVSGIKPYVAYIFYSGVRLWSALKQPVIKYK